ncbi:hypothetical protein MVEN_00729900 [Mycena venus]|uniref:Uncharacterized protein n=1 Tax=Mycena venus TaxID=2733690 RepID=A0A8H6YHS5_9AGAR|nr:hypothetical protein MVEN_00729900 [Mycena venus]
MGDPDVARSEPFPIGAVVGAATFVLVFGAIIAVFSFTQKRRNRKPIGSVETAEGTANPRRLKIQVPDREPPKVVEPDTEPHSRADGSTIYVSSPSVQAYAI